MMELCEQILINQGVGAEALTWRRPEILGYLFELRDPELLNLFNIGEFNTNGREKSPLYSLFRDGFSLITTTQAQDIASPKVSKETKDSISRDVSGVLQHLEKAKTSIEEVASGEQLPSDKLSLSAAFEIVSKGGHWIQDGLATNDVKLLQKGVEELRQGYEAIVDDLIYLVWQKGTRGSSKDKQLNLLINTTHAFREKTVSQNFFQVVWMVFAEYFRWSARNFRRLARIVQQVPEIDKNIMKQAYLYGDAKKAFQELYNLLVKAALTELDKPFGVLQNFFNEYSRMRQDLWEQSQRILEGMKNKKCPRCGFENELDAWACRLCKLTFPQVAAFSPAGFGIVMSKELSETPFLEILANVCEDFKDEELTHEEFHAVLNWVEQIVGIISKEYENLNQSVNPPEVQANGKKKGSKAKAASEETPENLEIIKGILSRYQRGIDCLTKALAALRRWSESKASHELDEGLRLSQEGASEIKEALTPLPTPEKPESISDIEESERTTLGIG